MINYANSVSLLYNNMDVSISLSEGERASGTFQFRGVANNLIMCRYKHVCGHVQRNAIHDGGLKGRQPYAG